MRRKYIIIDGWAGIAAILFPEVLTHKDVFAVFSTMSDCVGAGFYTVKDGVVTCFDKSTSLGILSRGQVDADIIQQQLVGDSP